MPVRKRVSPKRQITKSLAHAIASVACISVVVVSTAGTAAGCSAPEEDFIYTAEEVDTVIEFVSLDIGYKDGEQASAFAPHRYWGEPPTETPLAFIGRSSENRRSLRASEECFFVERGLYREPGATILRSERGNYVEDSVDRMEAVHGAPIAFAIDEQDRARAIDELELSPLLSALFWQVHWPWAAGAIITGGLAGATALQRHRRTENVAEDQFLEVS